MSTAQFKGRLTIHSFTRVARRVARPVLIPVRVLAILRTVGKAADLVHFHDIDLLPWMYLLSWFKPVIYDVHENYADEMLVRDWIPRPMRKPLYWSVKIGQRALTSKIHNAVLVVPDQLADFPADRLNVQLIRNYASLELLKSVTDTYDSREPAVVFTGSQYAENGSLLLLDIAQGVSRIRPGISFLVPDRFASPVFRKIFLARRKELGLEEVVRLYPNLAPQDLMQILNQATIALSPGLLVPKQIKAIPTKVFEYMAAGLPIVGSDLPHQRAILEEIGCGIVCDADSPDAFVRAIVELADNPQAAREIGIRGQQAFRERYSWESQMPGLLEFYENILHRKN